jgi:hypothetical protein
MLAPGDTRSDVLRWPLMGAKRTVRKVTTLLGAIDADQFGVFYG